jgi:uncharacterized protein
MAGHASVSQQQVAKSHTHLIAGCILFVVAAIIGLFWAKWNPYFHKVFIAASEHNIGASIVSGDKVTAAPPSIATAWSYSLTYFNSIWKAFLVSIILASLVQVALPANWIRRVLGKTSFGSTMIAGLSALPGMMCTCCTAPLVVGLRKQKSSVGAASAFWLGNPALNPAVLIFMFFILGWKFTLLRLVFGAIIVFGLTYLAGRYSGGQADVAKIVEQVEKVPEEKGNYALRWLKSVGILALTTIPAYLLSVFVLGGLRAWIFPAVGVEWGNSILMMIFFAIVGTLFVIPTAGEIPIIQTLMAFGLASGPAAVLAIVLPVISLPSALMVRRALSWRVLTFLGAGVMILGFCAGLIGMAFI